MRRICFVCVMSFSFRFALLSQTLAIEKEKSHRITADCGLLQRGRNAVEEEEGRKS